MSESLKKFVTTWLWENESRTTVNREWDNQYITDTALMIADYNAQLTAENEALRKARDAWRGFAQHQEDCQDCADNVSDCHIGQQLKTDAVKQDDAAMRKEGK